MERDIKHLRKFSQTEFRVARLVIGLGVVATLFEMPKIQEFIDEFNISSNPNDYSIEIKTKNGDCYANQYPTTTNALQETVIKDTYCTTRIKGNDKFKELVIKSDTLISVDRVK